MARLTQEDWFRVACEALVAEGEAGLTIQSLTARAGRTHGSFYHHFGDQAGFTAAFLAHLAARAFVDIPASDEYDLATRAGGRRALRRLVEVIAAEDLRLEAAVRRWGQRHGAVAALVAEVDARRAELVLRLFLAATGDLERAVHLARLNGAFFLGAVHSEPPIQGAEYARMAADLERLLDDDGSRR